MRHRVDEQLGRLTHDARHITAGIDRGIPMAAFQGCQIAVAVAVQLFDAGKQVGIRLPSVEQRELVPSLKHRFGQGTTQEPGAAKNQNLHAKRPPQSVSENTSFDLKIGIHRRWLAFGRSGLPEIFAASRDVQCLT